MNIPEADKIICSLDEQQCQQECKHKSDRTKCPFVTLYPKKLYEGINRIAKQSTAPDKETPDWLLTDIRRGAEYAYSLSRDKVVELEKEVADLKRQLEKYETSRYDKDDFDGKRDPWDDLGNWAKENTF